MTTQTTHSLPTLRQLIKATLLALVGAGALLVSAVLPAEYGIDPTGIGKALGLVALSGGPGDPKPAEIKQSSPVPADTPAQATDIETRGDTVAQSQTPLRNDELILTLNPGEGAEAKAAMRKGEQFVFSWQALDGKVNFDMHGERPNAGDQFTSYWKAKQQTGAQGVFIAPFDGTHGWYWRNRGDKSVSVKVKVSGFYDRFYRP